MGWFGPENKRKKYKKEKRKEKTTTPDYITTLLRCWKGGGGGIIKAKRLKKVGGRSCWLGEHSEKGPLYPVVRARAFDLI